MEHSATESIIYVVCAWDGNARRAQRYPTASIFSLASELIEAGGTLFPNGYGADVCGGCGGVAKAAISLGTDAFVFDTASRLKDDITRLLFLRWLEEQLSSHKIKAVVLALPCNSFSLANSRSGKALRSKNEPRGIKGSDFTFRERERILNGKRLLDAGIKLIGQCISNRVPICLENPKSSYMWSDPKLVHLLRSNNAFVCDMSQCVFGARWRKQTTLAFLNV